VANSLDDQPRCRIWRMVQSTTRSLMAGTFVVFGSDPGGFFTGGTGFTLTRGLRTEVQPPPVPPFPTLQSVHGSAPEGALRDRVSRRTTRQLRMGIDGTFTAQLAAGSGNRVVTGLHLARAAEAAIDTIPNNGLWVLGLAASSTTCRSRMAVMAQSTIPSQTVEVFVIFAADGGGLFTGGVFTLTAEFSDGSIATAPCSLRASPSATWVADRTESARAITHQPGWGIRWSLHRSADPGSGNRTVTSLQLARDGGGNWDTAPNNWSLGARRG
jgi:hypothetical protein